MLRGVGARIERTLRRSRDMEGIRHESKPALARRDTRERDRGSDRDLRSGQKRTATENPRSGSIAH